MNAVDVARQAGLELTRKGACYWVRCPLHGEKTASLCFFPDDRWFCFGCHAHGDAADLFSALHNVSLAEALRAVRGASWRPAPASKGVQLRQKVVTWRDEHWRAALDRRNAAMAVLQWAEAYTDRPEVWAAAAQRALAEDELNLLESASPANLLRMMGGNP